ncbi:hypothetical protein DID88_007776 [Monilinia fructigena]|uniref:Uncharacterized protein n=1 Tax=Monilinia fructigena TaxID=38457 RepID=A0A395J3Z7_9HELO|nr:hypothetical protein DID88_007776 [Monilinia fructigena]
MPIHLSQLPLVLHIQFSETGYQIWYQSSNAKDFSSPATMTSTSTTLSIPTIILTNSSNIIDPTTSDKSGSGLSMGTKVAIAVSTSILMIALAIGTAMYLIRKRKGKRPGRGFSAPMTDDAIMLPEYRKELGNKGAALKLFVYHGDVKAGNMIVGIVDDEEVGGNETPGERRENKVDVRVTELPG